MSGSTYYDNNGRKNYGMHKTMRSSNSFFLHYQALKYILIYFSHFIAITETPTTTTTTTASPTATTTKSTTVSSTSTTATSVPTSIPSTVPDGNVTVTEWVNKQLKISWSDLLQNVGV